MIVGAWDEIVGTTINFVEALPNVTTNIPFYFIFTIFHQGKYKEMDFTKVLSKICDMDLLDNI